jgi:hypothetical protein
MDLGVIGPSVDRLPSTINALFGSSMDITGTQSVYGLFTIEYKSVLLSIVDSICSFKECDNIGGKSVCHSKDS